MITSVVKQKGRFLQPPTSARSPAFNVVEDTSHGTVSDGMKNSGMLRSYEIQDGKVAKRPRNPKYEPSNWVFVKSPDAPQAMPPAPSFKLLDTFTSRAHRNSVYPDGVPLSGLSGEMAVNSKIGIPNPLEQMVGGQRNQERLLADLINEVRRGRLLAGITTPAAPSIASGAGFSKIGSSIFESRAASGTPVGSASVNGMSRRSSIGSEASALSPSEIEARLQAQVESEPPSEAEAIAKDILLSIVQGIEESKRRKSLEEPTSAVSVPPPAIEPREAEMKAQIESKDIEAVSSEASTGTRLLNEIYFSHRIPESGVKNYRTDANQNQLAKVVEGFLNPDFYKGLSIQEFKDQEQRFRDTFSEPTGNSRSKTEYEKAILVFNEILLNESFPNEGRLNTIKRMKDLQPRSALKNISADVSEKLLKQQRQQELKQRKKLSEARRSEKNLVDRLFSPTKKN